MKKDKERNDKTSINTSPHTVKTTMLTHTKIQTTLPRCFSSLPFSLPIHSKYLISLIKKFRDDIKKPSEGSHLLRGFSQTNQILPKHSLQTWHISKTHPCKLPKLHEHKFDLQTISKNVSIFSVNKLTMLFTRVINSRSNSFQLGGHDTTQLDKEITKDTTKLHK